MFVHTGCVSPITNHSVKCFVKGKSRRIGIGGPRVQKEYCDHMGAVDKNDCDSADWTTTIQTNRYYLRIFCWVLDRVVYTVFVVVIYLALLCIGETNWNKYSNKNGGRRQYQIDLGIEIINFGIDLDWPDPRNHKNKPRYINNRQLVPCDCKVCFFCVRNLTNGIHHKSVVIESPDGRMKYTKCSGTRVFLCDKSKYCKQCYRKQFKLGT